MSPSPSPPPHTHSRRQTNIPDVDALLPHGGGHVVLLDDPLGQELLVGQDAGGKAGFPGVAVL